MSGAGRRGARRGAIGRVTIGVAVLLALASVATPLATQRSPQPPRPATRVTLVIRPQPGDRLRVLVEHETEESGTLARATGDTTVTTRTATRVVARTDVERADAGGSVLRTTIDSVAVDAQGGRLDGRVRRRDEALALRGRTVRLRLGGDGAVTLLDAATPAVAIAALAPIVERVPAVFPEGTVGVGDRWTRRVALPGAPGDAVVAEFRLDSLTQGAQRAWVSVSGGMEGGDAAGSSGTVAGWLVLDRRRGWIVASRLALALRTTVRHEGTGRPLRFRLRLDQRMRELP